MMNIDEEFISVPFSNFQTTFRITEYFKEEFEGLRKLFDVNNEQFYHSLGSSKFFETSGGKSNSDFMITVDNKVRNLLKLNLSML